MFKLLTLHISAKISYTVYKGLNTGEDLKAHLETALTERFKYKDRQLGTFLGIKDLWVLGKPLCNPQDLSVIQIPCRVAVYMLTLAVNQLVVGVIDHIDQSANLIVTNGLDRIYIHHTQVSSNATYNYQKEQVEFDKKILKVNDIVKLRIIEKALSEKNLLKLRGTLRGPALGKKTWWTHGK